METIRCDLDVVKSRVMSFSASGVVRLRWRPSHAKNINVRLISHQSGYPHATEVDTTSTSAKDGIQN